MLDKLKTNDYYKLKSMIRDIRFDIFTTTFAGMSGQRVFKNIKKKSDIEWLPEDEEKRIRNAVLPISKEHALSKIREAHKRK